MKDTRLLKPPLLFLPILATIALTQALAGGRPITFNGHDTYMVVGNGWLYGVIALLLIVLWNIYIVFNQFFPSKLLIKIHVYSIALFYSFTVLATHFNWLQSAHRPNPVRYDDVGRIYWNLPLVGEMLVTCGLIIGMLCWVINLMNGIVSSVK